MITKREAGAVLAMSTLWGVLHGFFGAVLGAWFFLRVDQAPWSALPFSMVSYAMASIGPGILAGATFSILLRRFERDLTVETLSITRIVGWGIVASLPTFALMYGTLPAILTGRYVSPGLLVTATFRSALAGALVALATLALARIKPRRAHTEAEPASKGVRFLGHGLLSDTLRGRRSKTKVTEFTMVPSS